MVVNIEYGFTESLLSSILVLHDIFLHFVHY